MSWYVHHLEKNWILNHFNLNHQQWNAHWNCTKNKEDRYCRVIDFRKIYHQPKKNKCVNLSNSNNEYLEEMKIIHFVLRNNSIVGSRNVGGLDYHTMIPFLLFLMHLEWILDYENLLRRNRKLKGIILCISGEVFVIAEKNWW